MALSGSYDFTRTRNQLITGAYRLCGVLGAGEQPSAEEIADGSEALNLMIKEWQNQDIGLWLQDDGVLFLDKSTSTSYDLGPSGDPACRLDDLVKTEVATAAASGADELVVDSATGLVGYASTELASDAAADATSLTVDSATNMAVDDVIWIELDDATLHKTTIAAISGTTVTIASGLASAAATDNTVTFYTTGDATASEIGVEQDDGTLFWTTIASISGTTLTLALPLTAAVAVDRNVYTFTSYIRRPLGILPDTARLHHDDGREQPLIDVDRTEYMALTLKTQTGTPVEYYYQPTLTNGRLYVWPLTTDVTQQIYFSFKRSIQDVDAGTDSLEFPPQWLNALRFNLAVELGIEHGAPAHIQQQNMALGRAKLLDAGEADDDGVAFHFEYARWG